MEDAPRRKRAEAQIAHLAHHDLLTDLPNRAAFTACSTRPSRPRPTTGQSFALMCLDLDRFKEVNDVFGHAAGDALLREVAQRLQAAAAAPSWRGSAATNSS